MFFDSPVPLLCIAHQDCGRCTSWSFGMKMFDKRACVLKVIRSGSGQDKCHFGWLDKYFANWSAMVGAASDVAFLLCSCTDWTSDNVEGRLARKTPANSAVLSPSTGTNHAGCASTCTACRSKQVSTIHRDTDLCRTAE